MTSIQWCKIIRILYFLCESMHKMFAYENISTTFVIYSHNQALHECYMQSDIIVLSYYHTLLFCSTVNIFIVCYLAERKTNCSMEFLSRLVSQGLHISNHWHLGCLFPATYPGVQKKTSYLRITVIFKGNQPVTNGFKHEQVLFVWFVTK